MKYETQQIWSLGAGAYQTWHIIRAKEHGISNLTDLTTPSYYTQSDKPTLSPNRLLVASEMTPQGYGDYLWFKLTKRGLVQASPGRVARVE